MSTTDRDVISWARRSAYSAHLRGFSEVNQKFRRLADLAEKGAEDWQPIAAAPKDTRVLLLNDEGHVFTGEVADGIGPMDDHGYRQNATHWRPLPAPPGGGR